VRYRACDRFFSHESTESTEGSLSLSLSLSLSFACSFVLLSFLFLRVPLFSPSACIRVSKGSTLLTYLRKARLLFQTTKEIFAVLIFHYSSYGLFRLHRRYIGRIHLLCNYHTDDVLYRAYEFLMIAPGIGIARRLFRNAFFSKKRFVCIYFT